MKTATILQFAAAAVFLALGFIGFAATRHAAKQPDATKPQKRNHRLFFVLMIISAWFMVGRVITSITKSPSGMHVEFEMFSERVKLFGVSFAETTVVMWAIIAIILLLALIFRLFIFPKFDPDRPKGLQNILELSVEAMDNFTKGILGEYSKQLAPYMYSLAFFMVLSAFSELFGFRPPTSDLVVTFAMGIITFALINYFGLKKKGVFGRIKSFASPTPVIFPFKIISDISAPVSLACRLFGNMIGGVIVMDLLKSVLGGYGAGLPAVAGLYFHLFHPLVQIYIFMILSLTFINEAVE